MEKAYFQMSRYSQPILIIFGTFGALTNIVLFTFRKSLRRNSCAMYFRALSCNDFLVLWIVVFPQWLQSEFDIDPSRHSTWQCKIYSYLMYTLYTLSPYFVVLACFDRLCTSSTHVKLRRIATTQMAQILIGVIMVIILLLHIYIPIYSELVVTPFDSFCAVTNLTFNHLLSFSVVLIYSFLPPVLMMIFCTITLVLLRQQRQRVMPVNQTRLRHRDHQLLKMLFIYVIWDITCLVPFTVTFFREVYAFGSLAPLTTPIVQIFTLLVNVAYATSFYMYTMGTPFYRDELCSLVRRIHHHLLRLYYQLDPRTTRTDTIDI